MTVEEKRGPADQFPVGMRVLAVDDDPTCLKLLETLLRRCKYHVTATNQAIVALKLLRENKDKFDLVISDVHMPDMDGFKLLELVGLEMDLPVIMLSANSDPKAVMNGITHGACDYLLKPVRMEELKNIWQHVVRRRKFDSKDHSSYDHTDDIDKLHHAISEGGHDPATSTSSDRNGRLNRKRKDQNEDDDDECDDNGQESEDPSTQKKPRVVWSVELHRKFVAAVNQLGIDKAMPKRILDLMNVEKLTRENVASHLQKYRLYLKRISSVANQQANMVAALGGKDSPYLPMGALDGVRNYHAFTGSGQLSTLASFQQGGNGMLGRLNSPTRPGLYGLGSSGMIQLGRAHNNVSNSIHDFGKLPQISFSGNQQTNLLQGMPTTLEPNQLQQQKIVLEPSNHLPNSFSDSRFSVVNSNNSFISVPNNAQILPTQQQQSNGFGTQSSNRLAVMTTDPFEMSSGISSNLPDLSRCTETWTGASPLNGFATNALPLSVPFSEENQLIGNMGSTISPIVSNVETNSHTVAPSNAVLPSLPDPMMGRDFQCQADFGANTIVIPSHANESSDFSDIRSTGSSMPRWDGQRSIETFRSNLPCNPSSNPMFTTHGNINTVSHDTGFSGIITNKLMDMTMINQPISRAPFSQNCSSASDNQLKFSEDYNFDPSKLQGGFNSNNYNSFDDLMSAIVKQEREDILIDGDVGCDLYSLETCM